MSLHRNGEGSNCQLIKILSIAQVEFIRVPFFNLNVFTQTAVHIFTFAHMESMRWIQALEFKLIHQFNQTNECGQRNLKPHAHAHPHTIAYRHGNANASYYYYLSTFKHPRMHARTHYFA